MRGRNVMMGYLKQADETSKTIDSEGFLASGDLGKISSNGYLFITGRAKELIITAGERMFRLSSSRTKSRRPFRASPT